MHARVGHGRKGHGRNGRLARAHVAQKQAVHHAGPGHVIQNLVRGLALLVRQREGQGSKQRVHMGTRGHMPEGLDARELDALPRKQCELQTEELVIGKASARLLRLRDRRGIMDGAQRSCLAHQATACHQTRGQGVAYVANVLESGRHDAPHP